MLKQIATGVHIHQSQFLQSNSIVIQGPNGALLVDPGITRDELDCLAKDLRENKQTVEAGFSTHPHWDHLLWHEQFGQAPRYGSADCAATIQNLLAQESWKDRVAPMLPADIAAQIPIDDLFGRLIGLDSEATHISWEGPRVRLIKHQAHAKGHTSLLIEESRVLIAGDMVSDILIPLVNTQAAEPIQDYLAGLELLEGISDEVGVFVPGHGSIGDARQLRARIELDRAYLESLVGGRNTDDTRLTTGPDKDWLQGVHDRQLEQLRSKKKN